MQNPGSRLFIFLTSYSTDQQTRKNILNSIIDGSWYCVMTGLTTSFLGVYALALGATDNMLGWLAALPALVALLSQIPAAIITENAPRRQKVLVPTALVFRLGYLLFAFIPFLPVSPVTKAWVFIALLSVMNFPGTICGVSWTAMMGDIFPSQLRGRVFSDRNMLLGLVTMGCTILAGPLLDSLPYPYNYTVLFLISFSALMLSMVYLVKIVETGAGERKTQSGQRLNGIRKTLSDKPFLAFVASMFIVHVGFNISAAMWTLLYVRVLLLSKTFIGLITVVSQLTSVLTYRWWGRLADRIGARTALFLGILVFVPQPFLHIFVRNGWLLIPLSVMSGFAGAGFTLVLFNVLLDISPSEATRPSYIAVFNGLMGLTGFLAPLIGVAIYQTFSMAVVFNLASVLRMVGLGFFAWQAGIQLPNRRRRSLSA